MVAAPDGGVILDVREERTPVPGPNEVVVRVCASSLNYHDIMVMTGLAPVEAGRIPMSDGAGHIVFAGENFRSFREGDQVLGTFFPLWRGGEASPDAVALISGDSCDGFAADLVSVPGGSLTRMPESLSYEEAATIPCAGVTAWRTMADAGWPGPGEVVVVQGSGGLSLWSLQLAKSMGASVVALTTSSDKIANLYALGADLVIDTKSCADWSVPVIDFTDGRGADLIVEVLGGENLARSIAACRMGGRIAILGFLANSSAPIEIVNLLLGRITIAGLAVGSHADQVGLCAHIEKHSLKPVVGKVHDLFALPEIIRGQAYGKTFGKDVFVADAL